MSAEEILAEATSAETGLAAPRLAEGKRFARFVITGGIAAVANVAARWLLGFLLPFEASITLAYLVGMTTAFVLARAFVFTGAELKTSGQYLRFTLVNVVAFAQVWLVSEVLARFMLPAIGWSWQTETVAHAAGVASPVVSSYFFHKHLSFRE